MAAHRNAILSAFIAEEFEYAAHMQEVIAKTYLDNSYKPLHSNSFNFMSCAIQIEEEREKHKSLDEHLNTYSNNDFQSHFKMTRKTFDKLVEAIEKDGSLSKDFVLSVRKCVEITIWFLTHTVSMDAVSDKFNVDKSTVHTCVHGVCGVLERLAPKFIVWPSFIDCLRIIAGFENIARFRGIIGALDRTCIPVRPSEEEQTSDADRHRGKSIVLQAVCSHDRLFTNCFVGWANSGAVDANVFSDSDIYKAITSSREEQLKYIPVSAFHLLGDASYGVTEWLMAPFRDGELVAAKHRFFNEKIFRIRASVKHTFSILKARFLKLTDLNVQVENAARVTLACCVLHNFCFIHGDAVNETLLEELRGGRRGQQSDSAVTQQQHLQNEHHISGIVKRQHLVGVVYHLRNE